MDNHPFWASILRRSLFRYTCAGLCPNLFIQHVYREFIHPVHWFYSARDKGWNRVLHLSHSQLHFCKAVGDLSSSSQDLHQKPGAFKSQPAAGPEGLLSKVKEYHCSSVCNHLCMPTRRKLTRVLCTRVLWSVEKNFIFENLQGYFMDFCSLDYFQNMFWPRVWHKNKAYLGSSVLKWLLYGWKIWSEWGEQGSSPHPIDLSSSSAKHHSIQENFKFKSQFYSCF